MPPAYTATVRSPDHCIVHAVAASSIHSIAVPPWTFPPQFTSVGFAMKRWTMRGAVESSV